MKLATYKHMSGRKLKDICSNSTVAGWGSQNALTFDKILIYDKVKHDPYLQCVNLPIITERECNERLASVARRNLTKAVFCAVKDRADACLVNRISSLGSK